MGPDQGGTQSRDQGGMRRSAGRQQAVSSARSSAHGTAPSRRPRGHTDRHVGAGRQRDQAQRPGKRHLPVLQQGRQQAQGIPKSFGPTALATPPTPFLVRHGATTGSLSLGTLDPGTFSCPRGRSCSWTRVTYSDTIVSDATGNSVDAQPDPISATLHIRV